MKYKKIGPYILLHKIAAGGMADIFLAKKSGPNNLNSLYAVKKILEKYAEMPEFHRMFHEEAKITNVLSLDIHKNVMTSATYEKVGKHYIFVMEYIKGLNLKHFLKLADKEKVQLSTEGILYIIAEIASGLNHLHNLVNLKTGEPLNLIHRDISPQNVMISHNGQIKIIDFGIAKASILEETHADAGIKGKMAYMSPEQATGNSLDNRSDIFSLGIMLWELLAKQRLFLADSSMKTLRNVKNCQIPDIKKLNPSISPRVEKILAKSLAKNKKERYKYATDFAQDLYQAIQEQQSFSSYNFEKLSKQIYTDDIIKNRRLLAKYMNMSTMESNFSIDITNVGSDIDQIDQEKTQDLNTTTHAKVTNTDINTLTGTGLRKSTPPNNSNEIDLNLSPRFEKKIHSKQKHLVTPRKKTRQTSLQNTSTEHRQAKIAKKKSTNSPIFPLAFSASLAIAAFFLLSNTAQKNRLINKFTALVHNISKTKGQNNIALIPEKQNTLASIPAKRKKHLKTPKPNPFLTYIHTEPAGVEIFINDRPINISPNNINLPKNKIIKITLKKYKYQTEEFYINTNLLSKKTRALSSINPRVSINKQEIRVILKKIKNTPLDLLIK